MIATGNHVICRFAALYITPAAAHPSEFAVIQCEIENSTVSAQGSL